MPLEFSAGFRADDTSASSTAEVTGSIGADDAGAFMVSSVTVMGV